MRGRALSEDEQIISMKPVWPGLKLRGRRSKSLRWVGNVRPQFQMYRIEVTHHTLRAPDVRVLSPQLTRLLDNEEGQLPHVYPPASDPTLCLFDPEADEWDHSMPISRTIVPWTLDWLACYELWLMTGLWTGGGRHPAPPADQKVETSGQ